MYCKLHQSLNIRISFPIGIPLRAIARNYAQLCEIARKCSRIARNCEEFTGLAIARKKNPQRKWILLALARKCGPCNFHAIPHNTRTVAHNFTEVGAIPRNRNLSKYHCSFLICHYSFLIAHLPLLIAHCSFVITHLKSLICLCLFVIPHCSFLICH